MATLRVTLGQVNITDDLLFVMRRVDDELADVYSQLFLHPHTAVRKFVVINRDPVNHYVDWYRSNVDGDKLALLHTTEVDLINNEEQVLEQIDFLVGGSRGTPNYDPAYGATQYINPDLDGLSYTVFKIGYGPLTWGIDIQTILGGGFEYINGDKLADNERYTLLIYKKVNVSASSSGGNSFPTDFIEFTDSITLDSTHYGMMLEANSTANLLVDIVDMTVIPDKTRFGISTHKGSQKYVTIALPSGAFCNVDGVPRNPIYIGRGEEAVFMKKGGELKIVSWGDDRKRVGQRVKGDGKVPVNGVPAIGGWKVKADVMRLLKWHIEELPVGEAITGTDNITPSDTDRSKYVIGQDMVWIIDRGGYVDINVDPDANVDVASVRKSGQTQAGQVGQFGLTIKGDKFKKSGTGANLVTLSRGDDVDLGKQDVNMGTINTGLQNRVTNVANNEYVII